MIDKQRRRIDERAIRSSPNFSFNDVLSFPMSRRLHRERHCEILLRIGEFRTNRSSRTDP